MEMKWQNVKGGINAELAAQQRPSCCQNLGRGGGAAGAEYLGHRVGREGRPPGQVCHLWAQKRIALSKLGPHWVLMEISVEVM